MKTVVILMDTLNRHMLKVYNTKARAQTPNIDRLAERSVIFDNHFIGSAPCMPARRDIFTGRLNFLERNWGPIEPYDVTMPQLLQEAGIFTHMITDHSHYVELGGEGYLQQFHTWDFVRGQETDAWASQVADPDNIPERHLGRIGRQYQCNRQYFSSDEDYPTPRTFRSAVDWLQKNEGADDFFLMVEAFDPHEPFDAPKEFQEMYPDEFDTFYEWPRYDFLNEDETEDAVAHLRNQYYATLSMADKWLGQLLDEMERQNLFEDTMVVFTSDHGHMLGEHGVTGKNLFHAWNEMSHIPLLVYLPQAQGAGQRIKAVTQNIDLFPTLLDYFEAWPQRELPPLHGKSLLPLLKGEAEQVREWALYGWFGMPVNITDGHYTYFRVPQKGKNMPVYAYGATLTTFPVYMGKGADHEELTCGHYLDWVDMPVYRLDMRKYLKYVQNNPELGESRIYDLETDYQQQLPIADAALEKKLADILIDCLREHQAPAEQFERLGLDHK